MSRTCEVCSTLEISNSPRTSPSKIRRLLIAERIVALCAEHAETAKNADPQNVQELRALYAEVSGRRSLLSQRSPLDRRVFPARPEGRRASAGRRTDDA